MSQRYLGGIITANPTTPTMASASGVWTLEQQFQYASVWQPANISRSVRLRSSASAYLNRTPASATNRQIMTFSMWVKLGATTGGTGYLFSTNTAAGFNDAFGMSFSSGTLDLVGTSGGATVFDLNTTQVFRDPSAWYHVVYAIDTTQATSSNRIKLYINGVQVTAFGTATYPPQNTSIQMNNNVATYIGRLGYTSSALFDGYLTEINFIDGQALTPSSFGALDSNGVWQPLTYTGTYGTNGFYLNFSDNSGVTATTIGKDSSGNGNNWTPNNISVTAGVTYDSMLDVPVNYADGGNGRGNYCVLNPFQLSASGALFTLSSGNLNYSCGASAGNAGRMLVRGTMALPSGKTYWEIKCTNTNGLPGIADGGYAGDAASGPYKYLGVYNAGQSLNNTTATYTGTTFTYTTNDIIGLAFDGTAMTLACYKNGSLIGTFSAIDSTVTWFPFIGVAASASSTSYEANFGQRPFDYTPPTGFVALNTQNLPAPTISNGAQYMAATIWTGDSATSRLITNTVNGVSFQPDFVWGKNRSAAYTSSNALYDSVRGAGSAYLLSSNSTGAEGTLSGNLYGYLSAFNSNGFTAAKGSTDAGYLNQSPDTYVAWQWKAGGTAVSNTSGSITSTVSAGATQGFSVVTWTGSGAAATVGHGLGVAPKMVIIKNRTTAASWPVYHASIGNTAAVFLNATNASTTSNTYFNNTSPTSSVFSVESATATNGSTNSMVAYCFAEVAGYSKFGSYTGNGSTDGPFVYLGFRPRFLLLKVSSTTGDWVIYDTSRNTYNVMDLYLYPDSSAAEGGSGTPRVDVLSNGFKLRNSGQDNTSGATYIFMAVAENPFKTSRAR